MRASSAYRDAGKAPFPDVDGKAGEQRKTLSVSQGHAVILNRHRARVFRQICRDAIGIYTACAMERMVPMLLRPLERLNTVYGFRLIFAPGVHRRMSKAKAQRAVRATLCAFPDAGLLRSPGKEYHSMTAEHVADPLFAMISEIRRLDALMDEACERAGEIWFPAEKRRVPRVWGRVFYCEQDFERFAAGYPDDREHLRAEYAREEARILASQEAAGCAHLYRQADEAKIRGDLLWERFIKTKPTSIEGALAKLEFLIGSDAGEATLTLIADLRSLCGVSAAEPDRAEEPSEIGFGEYEPRI
jgi:hypothetical protein